jgi:hypothetical protein
LRIFVIRYGLTKEHSCCKAAAEFILSWQTKDRDIRGMVGKQYAPYYTWSILAVLIKAGYQDDPSIEKGLVLLTSMRQDDGGWIIPILTHKLDKKTQNRFTSRDDKCIAGALNWFIRNKQMDGLWKLENKKSQD